MIIVAYKPFDPKKQANFTPLIIKITLQVINQSVRHLKKKVHQHFKSYLSPFINEQNLVLSCKQSNFMINDVPLYMYINPKQYHRTIICTTQPKKITEEEIGWKRIKNSLICKISTEQKVISIHQKEIGNIDWIIEKVVKQHKNFQVIINSNFIEPTKDVSWSKIVSQGWKYFAKENECIYMKVCV